MYVVCPNKKKRKRTQTLYTLDLTELQRNEKRNFLFFRPKVLFTRVCARQLRYKESWWMTSLCHELMHCTCVSIFLLWFSLRLIHSIRLSLCVTYTSFVVDSLHCIWHFKTLIRNCELNIVTLAVNVINVSMDFRSSRIVCRNHIFHSWKWIKFANLITIFHLLKIAETHRRDDSLTYYVCQPT